MPVTSRRLIAVLFAVTVAACQPGEDLDTRLAANTASSGSAPVEQAFAGDASSQPAATGTTAASAVPESIVATTQPGHAEKNYFIDFRARYAYSYGHTFVMFGRLDANGQMIDPEVAGLHPASDSATIYMLGHVLPVPSETGVSDGDMEEEYLAAKWRVLLTKEEYDRTVSIIRDLQASRPVWHAALYNCNAFGADIARAMGFRTPFIWLMPEQFINRMREMNQDRHAFAGLPASDLAPVRAQ